MDITGSLQNALDAVVTFVPRALAFLAILLVGWIVAKVLRRVVTKLLARVGLDRVAERGGMRRFTGKYSMSQLSGMLVYFAVLLFTLVLAFNAFGPNPVSDVLNSLVAWLPQLFIAGVIMVVAFAIANTVYDLVSGAMSEMSYGKYIARAAQVAIIAVAAIAALNQIGIATTVTTPILVAGLAMIVGVVVVGVGGGMIQPMRDRWERMLGAAEQEAGNMSSKNRKQEGDEFGQPGYRSAAYDDTKPAARPSHRESATSSAGRTPTATGTSAVPGSSGTPSAGTGAGGTSSGSQSPDWDAGSRGRMPGTGDSEGPDWDTGRHRPGEDR
ncbi:putative transporter (transmembrane protein) [Stackebrandtia albiflava]|uniref:Putative transporter (Transmembrane protein) n=1 Tax=Stackebrandtia albiflava TaxID=406432 RepID=A0A562V2P9_9ACTN|nr:hypothetical protein [Stackebrandtia albiflava]TWJ12135.1 putative transporter (transmembrane protein) [Stackebrandtia albiflava]